MAKKARLDKVREEDYFGDPKMGVEEGSSWSYFDQWHVGTTQDGKYAVDMTAAWEARDMHEMLTKDYRATQIESVMTQPLLQAKRTIEPIDGDSGEAEWLSNYWKADVLNGGCRTSLEQIIALMTSGFFYRRAYFEKVFATGFGQFEGNTVYADVAWRPQSTCRMLRDPKTGKPRGFEQEAMSIGDYSIKSGGDLFPIRIDPERAFVYTHGMHRDPLSGKSDLEVAYWAWKTKQKILLLWFQFLQGVSLPKTIVKAQDQPTANQVAQQIAKTKSSGVLPVGISGGPESVNIEPLDLSGQGADQFKVAMDWLDQAATQSVLAGFLDLTSNSTGTGSYALSNDASSFFLMTLEHKCREIETQIRQGLFAPLIRHNFGPKAPVPELKFEPLSDVDKDMASQLLQVSMSQPNKSPAPSEFTAALAGQVARYLGLDEERIEKSFKASLDAAAAQEQAETLDESEEAQGVAGIEGATKAAQDAVNAGMGARTAFDAARDDDKKAQQQRADRRKERERLAKQALEAKTGRKDLS